jgi:hypothetical protein
VQAGQRNVSGHVAAAIASRNKAIDSQVIQLSGKHRRGRMPATILADAGESGDHALAQTPRASPTGGPATLPVPSVILIIRVAKENIRLLARPKFFPTA